MRITRHAALRLSERTKLSKVEFKTIIDKFAYVTLHDFEQTLYVLFYDARGDEFFVAVIRNNCVITIICLWQKLHKNVKALATTKKFQKQAQTNFYNRAARSLYPGLQSGLNVYVSFKTQLNKIVVPEEYVHRIDSNGHDVCKPIDIIKCFAEEISRILVREITTANANWIVCITLRRLNGQIVHEQSSRIGKIVDMLPLYGQSHDVHVWVRSKTEDVKLELGKVAVEDSFYPDTITSRFREQFAELLQVVQSNYSFAEQLKFKYAIELQNKRLSWSRMLPVLSHFELREFIYPRHPS